MLTIGAVARETGIHAATLRKWEIRYGFPVPLRTEGDQRAFRASDLAALTEVARRMATGERASIAIHAVRQGLHPACSSPSGAAESLPPEAAHAMQLLSKHEMAALESFLATQFKKQGAALFARALAAPLVCAVGAAWQQGRLPVYAEHLFSSILQRVTAQASPASQKAQAAGPVVLLASPSGESHNLALVLLHAVLLEAGFTSILLQGGLPATEIAAAARAFKVSVVAVSASSACSPKLLCNELHNLRELLGPDTALWVGGSGTKKISRKLTGVTLMTSFETAVQSLQENWPLDKKHVVMEEVKNYG